MKNASRKLPPGIRRDNGATLLHHDSGEFPMRYVHLLLRSTSLVPVLCLLIMGICFSSTASAVLTLSDSPLFLSLKAQPLNLLVMGRDHKLYYEAYDDTVDLDGDGQIDVGYKGWVTNVSGDFVIDYYGYFDSRKCYSYDSTNNRFVPQSVTANKQCTGQWSGDFLNYLTMSRMDVLRKVLYGGKRSTDTTGTTADTVLERVYIPQDTHSWAKEYTSTAVDGYNISNYTPLGQPTSGTRHLIANTTRGSSEPSPGNPLLRILQNRAERAWDWVAREVLEADNTIGAGTAVTPTDYVVRVQACRSVALNENNCRAYTVGANTYYKPTGLLQDNASDMKFGLMTGSYTRNLSGGVLRKLVGNFSDEVNTNGTFNTSTNGIVSTLNKLRVVGYNGTHNTTGNSCGLIPTRSLNEGECRAWGNPLAEMLYEGLRYYSGRSGPTSVFSYTGTTDDSTLGLPLVTSWTNPYGSASNQNPWCAKPNMLILSDVYPSYDTDQLPGIDSNFGSGLTSDIPSSSSLNVSTLGQTIWDTERGGTGICTSNFIGQVGSTSSSAPTAKSVCSFGNIRGLAPEEPTKQGGYYSASIAYWAHTNDVNSITGPTTPVPGQSVDTGQKIDFYAVALPSHTPTISIPVGTQTITLVPFAKSVNGAGVNPASTSFQPTNSLARVFVQSIGASSGTFRVNFEDQEQGNDFDMDGIVQYTYNVTGSSTVDVSVTLVSAAGGITQHFGYVISGTTSDGTYLDIRDETACGSDTNYYLDTPNVVGCLPTTNSRTFTTSSTPAATILKDPLWYMAKWGGFKDSNANSLPTNVASTSGEWDVKNNRTGAFASDGLPDNYFYVTNPLGIPAALNSAFDNILKDTGSAASVAINTASLNTDSLVYQAQFTSSIWMGQIFAKSINATTGAVSATATWDAGEKLEAQNWNTGRTIYTWNPNSTDATKKGAMFRYGTSTDGTTIGTTNSTILNNSNDGYGQDRLDYIRGDNSREGATSAPSFRVRQNPDTGAHFKLGDIVNSAPIYVGAPPFLYPDSLESVSYTSFRSTHQSRTPMIYAGANDGMLHGFNACGATSQPGCGTASEHGQEKIAYVPSAAYNNLVGLVNPGYGSSHKYFVDLSPTSGDVFGNFSSTVSGCTGCWRTVLVGGMRGGGRSYFALDVTDPSSFSETSTAAHDKVLWEYSHTDLGYTFSEVTIAKMHGTSRWAAIFGNGYNSTNGYASLFIVDVVTGTLLKKIDLETTGNNGLSTPAVVDTDGDYIADYIYAGDLKGNMWKIDVTSTNVSGWDSFYRSSGSPRPLFKAVDGTTSTTVAQPITSRPDVGRHPDGLTGYMVYFGTGKYVEPNDNNPGTTPSPTHSFYGIWDPDTGATGGTPVTRSDLLAQTITEHTAQFDFNGDADFDDTGETSTIRRVTNNTIMWNGETYANPSPPPASTTGTHRGWRVDLLTTSTANLGEMMVANPILRTTRVIFTTLIPDTQSCAAGGSSWLMELNYQNGGQLPFEVFDLNGDGLFNASDQVGGQTVSGVKTGLGISPSPTMLDDPARGRELKILTGSSGGVSSVANNPGPLSSATGRRSWRQIK